MLGSATLDLVGVDAMVEDRKVAHDLLVASSRADKMMDFIKYVFRKHVILALHVRVGVGVLSHGLRVVAQCLEFKSLEFKAHCRR